MSTYCPVPPIRRPQPTIDGLKMCVRCKVWHPADFFHRNPRTKTGRVGACKACRNKTNKVVRESHLTVRRDADHRLKRNYDLAKYGLTVDGYDALNEAQGGTCAICRRPERKRHQNGRLNALAVDHCHDTGRVRGLLCNSCNRGLGLFGEKPELLTAASTYLEGSSHTLVQK